MSDEPVQPDAEQAPGWMVLDPDGNVVDSGPVVVAQAAFTVGEDDSEGEQE